MSVFSPIINGDYVITLPNKKTVFHHSKNKRIAIGRKNFFYVLKCVMLETILENTLSHSGGLSSIVLRNIQARYAPKYSNAYAYVLSW